MNKQNYVASSRCNIFNPDGSIRWEGNIVAVMKGHNIWDLYIRYEYVDGVKVDKFVYLNQVNVANIRLALWMARKIYLQKAGQPID